MLVGYARVSDKDQHIEAQLDRLSDCEKVFSDVHTSRSATRPELERCLDFVRAGDTLRVTRLDRLARSVQHLCAIAATLERKGVELVVLDQHIDTATPVGKLLFHLIAAIAEFELDLRKEQQRAGIARARKSGKYTGGTCKLSPPEQAQLVADFNNGIRASALAKRYRLSKRTVYRYVASASCPLAGVQRPPDQAHTSLPDRPALAHT